MPILLILFFLSLLFSLASHYVVIRVLKIGTPQRGFMPDALGTSKTDKSRVSAFGGACMLVSVMASLIPFWPYMTLKVLVIFLPVIAMFCIGFLDDLVKISRRDFHGISARAKLILQWLVAATSIWVMYVLLPELRVGLIKIPVLGYYAEFNSIAVAVFLSGFAFVGMVNGVNLTDGLDGLAGKQVLIILVFLAFFSNSDIALESLSGVDNDSILMIIVAFMASVLGFLAFNANPASIFMGDSGSMMFGSLLASLFIVFRVEVLIPIVCIIFFIESLSVIAQVMYFKITGGKRIFKMAPIHHHYQLLGFREQKITDIFMIVTCVACTVVTLSIFT